MAEEQLASVLRRLEALEAQKERVRQRDEIKAFLSAPLEKLRAEIEKQAVRAVERGRV